MAKYSKGNPEDFQKVKKLISNHEFLRKLDYVYNHIMFEKQTIEPMGICFPQYTDEMEERDRSNFTSLILKLDKNLGRVLFDPVKQAYEEIEQLVTNTYPKAKPEIYFDSAHLTIRAIVDKQKQDKKILEKYLSILHGPIEGRIDAASKDLILYGMGLFTNLHEKKGLSIGIRFYSSTSLIHKLREIAKVELYKALEEKKIKAHELNPDPDKHTTLTHSTGMRIRNLKYPLKQAFVEDFKKVIQKYNNRVFGKISDIKLEDIWLRNGKSDKLIPSTEICIA